ncbi:hypothetical protein LOK49_LG01G00173, partial [Camellia lanceoleosa]
NSFPSFYTSYANFSFAHHLRGLCLSSLHSRRHLADETREDGKKLQKTRTGSPLWLGPYLPFPYLEFFVRTLKEGSRPIDFDPCCLISPVDGTILRFGELKGAGSMIEQVKGFSYFVSSFLGASPFLPMIAEEDIQQDSKGQEIIPRDENKKSCLTTGLFYCVIYLKPGDYHRIHSPVDWNALVRQHFSGMDHGHNH